MDIGVASTFWLLWTALPWTLMHRFLFKYLFLILSGTYLGEDLLGHLVILFNILKNWKQFLTFFCPLWIVYREHHEQILALLKTKKKNTKVYFMEKKK